jgi:hypothetical protein
MTDKYKIVLLVVALAAAFACGRYLTPEKVRTETETVEVEKKVYVHDAVTDQMRHKKTTVVEVSKPDGSKEKTTVISDDTETSKTEHDGSSSESTKIGSSTSETTKGSSRVTISALAAFDSRFTSPNYGASVTRPVLGPITLGLFALTPGIYGASVGLTF